MCKISNLLSLTWESSCLCANFHEQYFYEHYATYLCARYYLVYTQQQELPGLPLYASAFTLLMHGIELPDQS